MGTTVDSPFRTELTSAETAAFADRGYHVHGPVFSAEEVSALRDACAAVCEGVYATGTPPDVVYWRRGDDPLAVRKLDNAWKANPVIQEAVTSPRLGRIAAQLIGAPGIRLWHDQYLYKPPRGGRVVTWHQDWAYWQMIAQCETVTCWIALSDVEPGSGPMVYLAGSQKLGLQPLPKGISGDDEQRPALPEGAKLEEVELIIPAGCAGFHHGLTLHGSGRNFSGQPRVALVAHVMSVECTYRPGAQHFNEDQMKKLPDCPRPGERFQGPQFPMMWPV